MATWWIFMVIMLKCTFSLVFFNVCAVCSIIAGLRTWNVLDLYQIIMLIWCFFLSVNLCYARDCNAKKKKKFFSKFDIFVSVRVLESDAAERRINKTRLCTLNTVPITCCNLMFQHSIKHICVCWNFYYFSALNSRNVVQHYVTIWSV